MNRLQDAEPVVLGRLIASMRESVGYAEAIQDRVSPEQKHIKGMMCFGMGELAALVAALDGLACLTDVQFGKFLKRRVPKITEDEVAVGFGLLGAVTVRLEEQLEYCIRQAKGASMGGNGNGD